MEGIGGKAGVSLLSSPSLQPIKKNANAVKLKQYHFFIGQN